MPNIYSKIVAGIDIGNSTTVALLLDENRGEAGFLSFATTPTTGVKGTPTNVEGCVTSLEQALSSAGLTKGDLAEIRINQAAPVISNLSMDTVSETVVIGSAMIGHNPDTPGGVGLAMGKTACINNLAGKSEPLIALVESKFAYYQAADLLNKAFDSGVDVVGAIVQNDDGVLIANRISRKIPIVDEVRGIKQIAENVPAAVEVAQNGQCVQTLSNPYGIAGLFKLNAQQTKDSIPVARSLTGCRSGVVLRAQGAQVRSRKIPAGRLKLIGDTTIELDVNSGADAILSALVKAGNLKDAEGESGTNVGGLISSIKVSMANLTNQEAKEMKISGLLAADTFAAVEVGGGLAGEYAMENVVMLAAMVQTSRLPMQEIAEGLYKKTGVSVKISGKEAEMALKGALTTPGAAVPLAVLDLGGGSTDAALISEDGSVTAVHHAGAGEMVTRMIDLELNLRDRDTAELIKKFPLARVDGLLTLHFEDGSVKFVSEPLPPQLFSKVVIVTDEELVPVHSAKKWTMDQITAVRRKAKKKVFLTNAKRALKAVAPEGEIRRIGSVVLVGGSAQDFEIGEILSEYLNNYRIAVGRANLLGFLPPHAAVALGLAISQN